jgi:cytoskeletal protein CcmA (bactofilin family)
MGGNKEREIYLAEDCKIVGTIYSSGNITIDGQVEGTIESKGDIVINQQGKVNADIQAENLTIRGELHGNIIVKNLLEITSGGILYGDMKTNLIRIEQGAKFVGKNTPIDQPGAELTNIEFLNRKTARTEEPISEAQSGESGNNANAAEPAYKPILYNRLAK